MEIYYFEQTSLHVQMFQWSRQQQVIYIFQQVDLAERFEEKSTFCNSHVISLESSTTYEETKHAA